MANFKLGKLARSTYLNTCLLLPTEGILTRERICFKKQSLHVCVCRRYHETVNFHLLGKEYAVFKIYYRTSMTSWLI